jgi:hypothetical protein
LPSAGNLFPPTCRFSAFQRVRGAGEQTKGHVAERVCRRIRIQSLQLPGRTARSARSTTPSSAPIICAIIRAISSIGFEIDRRIPGNACGAKAALAETSSPAVLIAHQFAEE